MFQIRHLAALAFTLVASASAQAGFGSCPQFFVNGVAPIISSASPAKQRELCFDAFAVLHSGQSKTAVYVVERLNKAQLLDANGEKRTNRFYEEARLPNADRSRLEDYKARITRDDVEVRFDRGHLENPVKSILLV